MSLCVNISKITPPSLPKTLFRPRLQTLLEKHKDKKLILILGQPAQGKTTLVASHVKTSKTPSAWMNLDEEDSDPRTLFYALIHSVQYVLQGVDYSHLLSPTLGRMEIRAGIPLFREWARSLFELISSPLQIVLDGLDRLSDDSPALKFMQILVEDAPPNIQLILLSREMPPPSLEFQHLKVRQETFVLTNGELAFTPDEIRDFFKKIRRISLNAEQLAKIYFTTEGWIGGLILLAEFLSRLPESSRGKHISEELPPAIKNEVFQYFSKEIFSRQPEQVQEFLLQSSILEILDAGFMEDLTGAENSGEVLRELVRRNLFVQSILVGRKGWLFRYHQLFRDFLKIRFESATKDEERRSLFSKAGELYEKRGELENAVKCFLEAKAYPQAGSVIEQLGMSLLRRERKKDLRQWILALPEGIIQDNPWLLFYLAMTGRFMGGREDVAARYKVYTLLKEKGDRKGHLISLARLIEASIYTGVHVVSVGGLIEEGEAILQRWQMDEYLYERAMLWYYLGLGHILGDGEIRKGILACQNAYLIAKRVKDINLQASALNFSALGYALVGEFSRANEIWKKLEEIVEKSVSPELRVSSLMVACCLANHQGDFGRGRGLLEKLRNEIEKYGFISLAPWIYEISGYLSLSQGEFSEAEEVAKQYLSVSRTLKNDFLKVLALRLLGLIYLSQGEFRKAKEATDQSLEALRKEAHSEYELQKVKVLLGLICYHLKKYQLAEKKLEEALKYFKAISSYNAAAEAHFVIALLKWNQGKKDGAVSHLQMGFKIAEEKKYDYFFFLGLKYLTKVCLLALELKVAGAMDYAAHLLSTRLSSGAEEELKKFSNHPDSKLREQAWAIRRMIHRSKVPLLRIETLGGLRIFRGDSPIEEEEWDRNQPKKLLKAILSRNSQTIPKEILMEDLWPEESPRKSENNLNLTLLRLRKSLEPALSKDFNSSYIHLHDDFVFLDPELCQVDAHLFLSLLKNGEEKENKGDIKGALSSYAEAMKIYKGDFLPEEVYTPWVDLKREELRRKYIEFLNRMAELYEKQGASTRAIACYKRAIEADPLLEEGCRNLMTLYSSIGRPNEALRTYEACKKAIEEGLKTKPDPLTTALHRKILERLEPI